MTDAGGGNRHGRGDDAGRVIRRPDPWRQFRIGLFALGAVLAVGTAGYVLIGLSPFDALYQTAITVTTVGYGEVGADQVDDAVYRGFTLVLVLVGAGTVVYTLSVLLENVVEGTLNDGLRRRRMTRQIARYDGHIVVVGWGRVGRSIVHYATRHNADVVVVDQDDADTGDLPLVVGDALEDATLQAAAVERARVVVAALDTDEANLALTLTARGLAPDVFLVARTAKQSNEGKFFQAGADRVVNPHEIGGSRMGALALHATVAEFLDEVLHDESHDVEIVEIEVEADSPAVNVPVGELCAGEHAALILAIRQGHGTYLSNPRPEVQIGAGDVLVALGSRDEVRRVRAAVARRRPMRFRGASTD